jgi:hypothetical protein
MNDQLSGQLTARWTIPAYARELLWLETESETVQAQGAHGLFTLSAPAEKLILRWGSAEGAALRQFRWQADSLEWDGTVRLGGYIDAMHITELPPLPDPVVVLSVGGQPLKHSVKPYLDIAERRAVPYPVPSFHDGLADEIDETVTTWMAFEGSPALTLAQDALVSKMRVYLFGRLAEQSWGWHDLFALPLALEAMTLFAP